MCSTSLKLIENASSNQLSGAVEFNQKKINTLLIQLLTINFISQNGKEIENETNNPNNNDIMQSSIAITQETSSTSQTSLDVDLEEYCERKLLCLSPILGFSRKNYFIENHISNDTRMEIVSFLKPIEIFKNISLINKQFNKNVEMIHQSYKYANVFCSKHVAFKSFGNVEKYCDRTGNGYTNIDWQLSNGQWVNGWVERLDTNEEDVYVSANIGDKIERRIRGYEQVAPSCTMSYRPGNKDRFVNILKRGYCSETCDVNLKSFYVITEDGRCANIIKGYIDGYVHDMDDIWRCGRIDFHWTWNEAIGRNETMFGVIYNDDDDNDNDQKEREKILENSNCDNEKSENQERSGTTQETEETTVDTHIYNVNKKKNKKENTKEKSFRIFQVLVNVDITYAYNKHDDVIQKMMNRLFSFKKSQSDRRIISILFHIDDIDNFKYFGSKTTLKRQVKMKKQLTNSIFGRYHAGVMNRSKRRLLRAINYPNYCVVTPCGVFCQMSDNVEERKEFDKWYPSEINRTYEAECQDLPISNRAINKVYYDKQKDQLCLKLLSMFNWTLVDSNAPLPLEKRYIFSHGNKCRLINGKIIDPRLIDKVKMENIEDVDRREDRYFELLREWKGCIVICIDITVQFNQFQEKIKNEYIQFHRNHDDRVKYNDDDDDVKENEQLINQIEWDNRKYFLNNDEMPYLKWNKKEDKITHDVYILLESDKVYRFDSKLNFFDTLSPKHRKRVLKKVLKFLYVRGFVDNTVVLVCKRWHRIAQNWAT